MKGFKRIISVVVALVLVCSSLPLGVFASGSSDSINWSSTNLVEGQEDIVLNDYNPRWLEPTLGADNAYKVNFNIEASATEGYRLTTLALRDPDGYGQNGLYIVFNGSDDQIRIGYEYTTNTSLIAVAGSAGIKTAGTYEVEVITYPDAIEVYLNGNAVSFYDYSDNQMRTKIATKTFSDGKAGYMAQGTVLDVKISDIAIYGEAEEVASPWSDINLVEGQEDIVLNDYNPRWLEPTLDAESAYKVNFNIEASATEGYRLTTLALRDPDGYGQNGLYIVFNGSDDQIRIGYEYTTNTSLIAVAGSAGIKTAGTYEIEVITYPDAIEVYLNGNAVSFYDYSDNQMRTKIATKTFSDGKAGYMAQGTVLDVKISDIAIYGEAEEVASPWSDVNLVDGQADITLNDYTWDWLSADIKADKSYKYNFNLQLTDTEGFRLPTVAVRDSSANSDGTDGLYVVFYGIEDQIRIGYEATTFTSLIGVAQNVGMGPAGTYAVEIISTPDSISVSINGTPVSFYDYSDGQTKQAVSVSGLKDGKAGFNAQGNVMDTVITDIAIYGEAEETASPWSDVNLVDGQADITLNDYTWDWLSADIKADKSYKYNFNIVASATEGYRFPTIALRDSSANSDGTDGLYIVFNNAEDQIRIGYEYTTNSSLIAVAGNAGIKPAGTYAVEVITTPTTIEVSVNGTPVSFTDMLDNYQVKTAIPVSGLKDGKAGFNAQGSVLDTVITDIAIYGEKVVEEETESPWSDTNLVDGQEDLTLDYFWKWMPTTIKGDASYKYTFNINASATEGYRFPTVAVRDVSANSDGTDGLYIVFNNAEDQIRIGYEYTTNASLIAVATGVGFAPAGTYEVEIITTPDTIEVYMNGNQITFCDMLDNYQMKTTIPVKTLKDGKAGFITQGNVMDTQITDIAIYGEKAAAEEDAGLNWSDTNIVDGQTDITLNDYSWDWLSADIKADKSYKYNFNLQLTDTEGFRLPTVAVRDYSANSDGTDGLYVVFYGVEDQIRIGYEATTYTSLIGVAQNVGMGPAGTYAVEIISTPDSISVSINGTPVNFYDYSDGQTKQAVSVSGLKDGKAGFNAQGNVMDCVVTDIAIYAEEGAETGEGEGDGNGNDSPWSDENLAADQEDIVLNDYSAHWLSQNLDANTAYKVSFDLVASDTEGTRMTTVGLRDANSDGSSGLYIVFSAAQDQIRIGYEYTTNSSLIAVATGTGITTAGTYKIEVITYPDAVEVYINGNAVSFYDASDGQMKTKISTKAFSDGKVGFIAQGTVLDAKITNIEIYADKNAGSGGDDVQVDTEAINNVIVLIDAIGTVTEQSGDAIAAAREAYDALTADEKKLVTNIETLTNAEAEYNQLNASQDIMLYSLSARDAMGYNHWTAMLGITDVAGGGMKFNWKNAGTNVRQGINRAVSLDGLHAVFSGWEATGSGKTIAIYFADIDSQESYTQILTDNNYQPLALIINGTDGTLGIASCEENYPITVIATSDKLKYDALAGKEWSLFMNDNGDGSYTVTVNGVSGVITKEMFDACNRLTQYDEVYLTICPWDWAGQTTGSLNVISMHDGDNACANDLTSAEMDVVLDLIKDINSIGIVTVNSLEKIEACEAKYAQLSDAQKGCVTNYDTLTAARYRYDSLNKDVDEPCLNYYSISTADLAGTNHWPNNLFYSDLADGGVKFEWKDGGTNVRRFINREVTLDGLHMVFGGLEAEDSVKKMAFYLADIYDTAADWTSLYSEYVQGQPTILALIFDFTTGTLTAHVEGQNDVVIIKNDCLTYEYLKDTVWDMKVEKDANGDYVFTVAGATGVLPASLCDAATRLTDRDNSMYVTISPWDWNGYDVAIDVLAIHGQNVVCAEDLTEAQVADLNKVIEAINDIYNEDGQIVPESEAKYLKAWELYDALPSNVQPLVANYAYLTLAEEVLDVVMAIDGIGKVTYQSGELIEQIRQMYKLLAVSFKETVGTVYQRVQIDVDKRLMVGNYDTLQKAIDDYYNIRKDLDLNGYTGNVTNDNQNNASNSGDKVSPNTGEAFTYSFVVAILVSIIAIAVVVCRKKFGKES